MGNYKLVFYGTEDSETNQTELTVIRNVGNSMFIKIEDGGYEEHIVLDVDTAVRFSREIKRVIAEMKEVDNG